ANSSAETAAASGALRVFEALRGGADDARVGVGIFGFERAKRRTGLILLPELHQREPQFQHSVGRLGRLGKALEHVRERLGGAAVVLLRERYVADPILRRPRQ